jgi:hypothetical protein
MKIINNFIDKEKFKILKDKILDVYFPWYLQEGVNTAEDGHFQFTHCFVDDEKMRSYRMDVLDIITERLKPKKIIRAKLNLLTKTEKIVEHGFHTDVENIVCKTGVLYINNNNGYTKFKNNKIIKSEENKFVFFKSNVEHTGTSCTDVDYRIALNINYF